MSLRSVLFRQLLSKIRSCSISPFKNGVSYLGFHTYISMSGQPIRRLKNQNKRNAQRKFLKMAKLTAEGVLPKEKLDTSYGAWKNHISHGNCHGLADVMDQMIQEELIGKRTKKDCPSG